jgi:nicotinamidase-related amidase
MGRRSSRPDNFAKYEASPAMMKPATALLVIDAQSGLLEGDTAVPNAGAVLDRLTLVLAAARAAGSLVIHLKHDGPPGALDEPGQPGWCIHPKAAPVPGEPIIRKMRDDGFDGTPLADLLARYRVTRLAVAGLLSEMCVSATVRGALARGLHVTLVRDAHATYDLEEIPAAVVARVAQHALGDDVEVLDAAAVTFAPSTAP